jgi:hypothetical protein
MRSYSQESEPTAAPKVNAFSLNPDNLGAIANSVNLHTGDLNLPLNLVSIAGRDGLSMDVSLFYNSANIENIVDTWNLDSPTGTVGLGWSLPQSKIVVDNKQTGARDDDEFYLIDGGTSTRLVCIGISNGLKYYKTKTYSNKTITYNYSVEKWEITREDGSRVIYGDANSNRNTVQWIIKWGNWIGSSSYAGSQQRQGIVWDISEVKNLWGDKVWYSYALQENAVGYGGTPHTEASYLTRINDSWGREVELSYQTKLADEFMEPHTEQVEPDAYQERYERKYLDKIYVRSDGNNFFTIDLKYVTNLLGNGNLTKRLLKSVTKTVPTGSSLPATQFDYLTSGVMKGALYRVSNGVGGFVSFDYGSGVYPNFSNKQLSISAPPGFAEPNVFFGDEFAVVTWRAFDGVTHETGPKNVIAEVYDWDGSWKKSSLGGFGTAQKTNYNHQNFELVTGKDFFATLTLVSGDNYRLQVFRRSESSGVWVSTLNQTLTSLGSHDLTVERSLFSGDNFVAVAFNGKIFRYVWNGAYWISSSVTETAGRHFTTASNNFIVSHNTVPNPDVINYYFLDETKNWNTKTVTSSFDNANGTSYWHSSNSVALGMIYGANEFILSWDDSYNLTLTNVGFGYPDASKVFITDESMIAIMSSSVRGLRFNGYSWLGTGDTGDLQPVYSHYKSSAGVDLLLWEPEGRTPNRLARRKEYFPNSMQWGSTIDNAYGNLLNTSTAGPSAFAFVDKLSIRNANGLWSEFQSPFPSGQYSSARIGLNHFIVSGVSIYFLKNGQIANNQILSSRAYAVTNSFWGYDSEFYNISPSIVVTCSTGSTRDFLNVTSLQINKILGYSLKDRQIDFPVVKSTASNSLGQDSYTTYVYNDQKASFDRSGFSPKYNLVTTIMGGTSVLSDKPNGYTEVYFFNGLSETELGDTFPDDSPSLELTAAKNNYKVLTGMPYRVKTFKASPPATLASQKETVFMVQQSPLYFGTPVPSYPYIASEISMVPLPIKIISTQDGIEKVNRISYNGLNQAYYKRESVTGLGDSQEYFYTFAWEKYPNAQSLNILAPIVQTLKSIITPGFFGFYTDCIGVRWKDWTCSGPDCTNVNIPAPYDSYSWKRNGFIYGFGWWDVANETPTADWKLNSRVNLRGSQGIELEQGDASNQLTSQILDGKQRSIASAINAGYNEIAYTGFEDASKGNWVWADGTITSGISKTGEKSINIGTGGITKTGLLADETYLISFWMKKAVANSGSVIIDGVGDVGWDDISTTWNYYEYKVKGVTSLTIKNSGSATVYIDDLRFHPSRARMTTQTYHPLFGVSSQTDANNQTIYTDHDEFGRTRGVMDNEKNIISNTIYNYKKQ